MKTKFYLIMLIILLFSSFCYAELVDDFETNIWSVDWRCGDDPYEGSYYGCSNGTGAQSGSNVALPSNQTSGIKTYSFKMKENGATLQIAMGEGDCLTGNDVLCVEVSDSAGSGICDTDLNCNGTFSGISYDQVDLIVDRDSQTTTWYLNGIRTLDRNFLNNKDLEKIFVLETSGGAGTNFKIDYILSCDGINFGCASDPQLENLTLTSDSSFNISTDNLTCDYDLRNDSISSGIAWYKNGNPTTELYLPFEGGNLSSFEDYSGNSRSVTRTGAVWSNNTGHDGNGAYYFDGINDNLQITDFDYGNEFTIMFWFKTDDLSGNNFDYMFSHGAVTTNNSINIYLSEESHGAYPRLSISVEDNTGNPSSIITYDDLGLYDDEWHLFTLTVELSDIKVYSDGVLVNTSSTGGGAYNPTTDIYLGEREDMDANRYFNGYMDDVRIYDYALSSDQILALNNSRPDVIVSDETSPLEVWQCRVTPFSNVIKGTTSSSNNLTINLPSIQNLTLNSTTVSNYDVDNLTCNYDLYLGSEGAIVSWYKNNTPNTLLFFPMEGNETNALIDYSGYGNNLTNNGSFWNLTGGYNNNGYFGFTAGDTDYLETTDVSNFINLPTGSISLWLKINTAPAGNERVFTFINSSATSDARFSLFVDGPAAQLAYEIYRDDNSRVFETSGSASSAINVGEWNHIVVIVEDGSGNRLYINGVQITPTYVLGNAASDGFLDDVQVDIDTINFGVAKYQGSYIQPLSGEIDDIRFYNSSISIDQILILNSSRPDEISYNETILSDVWQCKVTPFTNEIVGTTQESNNITTGIPSVLVLNFITPTPVNRTSQYTNDTNIRIEANGQLESATLNFNGTTYAMTVEGNQSYYNLTNLPNGYYSYNVTANVSDGTNNITETRSILIDTIAPFIFCNFTTTPITYTTFFNFTFFCNGSDENLYRGNHTLYNSTGGVVWNIYYDDINNTYHQVNLSSNLTQGYQLYNWEVCYSDDHNKWSDKNEKPTKEKYSNTHLKFNKNKGKKFSETLLFFYDDDFKLLDSPSNLNTWFVENSDHWDFSFNAPNNFAKIQFELKTNDTIVDRSDAELETHLVYNNFYHEFDSAKVFKVNGEYRTATLQKTKINDQYYIITWIPDQPIFKDDVVEIDPLMGGNNIECKNFSINYLNEYASLEEFDIFVPDVTVIGDTYQLISNTTITIGDVRDVLMRGSLQLSRTLPSSDDNQLYIRMVIDDVIVFDSLFGNVEGPDDVKLSNRFANIPSKSGTMNVVFYAREEGPGNINLENFEVHSITSLTDSGSAVNYDDLIYKFVFNSSIPVNVKNITINNVNDSKVLIDVHDQINSTGNTSILCFIYDPDNNILGAYRRNLPSSSDIGYTGVAVLDNVSRTGDITYKIFCSNTNNESVEYNSTGYIMEMRNVLGQKIHAESVSRGNITQLNNTDIILELNDFIIYAGDGTEGLVSIGFQNGPGSTSQTVGTELFYDGSMSANYSRYLSDVNSIATVRYYSDYNQTTTTNYSLKMYLEAGESILIGAGLVVVEVSDLTVNVTNTPPIVAIDFPLNGSRVWFDDQDINVTVQDLNANLDHCEAYLWYNDSNNNFTINTNFTDDIKVNYTNYTYGNYSLEVLCYDSFNAAGNNTIELELGCVENWTIQFETCNENFTTIQSYFDSNSCGTNVTLPVDNGTSTDCVCQDSSINMGYYVIPYCDINDTCYVYATATNRNESQKANTRMMVSYVSNVTSQTNVSSAYDTINRQFAQGLTSNESENLSLVIWLYTNTSNVSCSNIGLGTMKFMDAYYVNISLFRDTLTNTTQYQNNPYINEFDYVYLVYKGTHWNSNNTIALLSQNMESWGEGVYAFNKMLPGSELIRNKNMLGRRTDWNTVYFWGEYNNGKANIRLFETGYYDLYVLNQKIELDNPGYVEFLKPAKDDIITYDNKVDRIYINQSDNYSIIASIFETQGLYLWGKIIKTIILIGLWVLLHIGLAMLPGGELISKKAAVVSTILLGIMLGLIWGGDVFKMIVGVIL